MKKFYQIDQQIPVKLTNGKWALPFHYANEDEFRAKLSNLDLEEVTIDTFTTAEMFIDLDHLALIYEKQEQTAFLLLAFE